MRRTQTVATENKVIYIFASFTVRYLAGIYEETLGVSWRGVWPVC